MSPPLRRAKDQTPPYLFLLPTWDGQNTVPRVEGHFVFQCPSEAVDSCSVSARLWRGRAATLATRWRPRTAFSRGAAPRSGPPPSRLGCPRVGSGRPSTSAGSLRPALSGPGFRLSLPRGLPRLNGEAEAEPPGRAAQRGREAFFRKGVHMTAGHSLAQSLNRQCLSLFIC